MSTSCPVCAGRERYYGFVVGNERFDQCRDCGLLSHKAVKGIEATDSLEYGADPEEIEVPGLFSDLLAELERYASPDQRRLGLVGPVPPSFADEARSAGFDGAPIREQDRPTAEFDVVLVFDRLEDSSAPVAALKTLRGHLSSGGVIAVVTRKLVKTGGGADGPILARRQRYSFSDENIQALLWKAGFADVFLAHHGAERGGARAGGWLKHRAIALGRMQDLTEVRRLSVVVPVFNEAATVREVLEALATRQFLDLDVEVIVVESNSTDGSREIVREYEGRPRFRVILEERPRGKGFAVRTGLAHTTGDVVLIQDADLEYDFLDYAMLLRPVLEGRAAFVLGTRHAGHWKIRKFAQHWLADLMNVAHWALVFAMNRLYGQSMTDPFTMFKVFRPGCLAGLEFECNRFDFDIELVCKLLRKGYTPLEIPVNYQARSFEEGKKVRIFRDPLTWLRAMWKYRTAPVVRMPPPRAHTAPAAPPRAVASSGSGA